MDWQPRNENLCVQQPWKHCIHFATALVSHMWGAPEAPFVVWCDKCRKPFPPGEMGSRQNEKGAGFCAACSQDIDTHAPDA